MKFQSFLTPFQPSTVRERRLLENTSLAICSQGIPEKSASPLTPLAAKIIVVIATAKETHISASLDLVPNWHQEEVPFYGEIAVELPDDNNGNLIQKTHKWGQADLIDLSMPFLFPASSPSPSSPGCSP